MRRRSRSRGGSQWGRYLLVVLLIVGFAVGATAPLGSFTTGSVDRTTGVDVVGDGDAILTLEIADNLTAGQSQQLVATTNYLGREVTLTVTLANTSYGDLQDDDETSDAVSDQLAPEQTHRVDIDLTCDPAVGETIQFRIQADDTDFEGDLNRTVEVSNRACASRHLVWAGASDATLQSRSESGTVYEYNATAQAIGPHVADLDSDDTDEIAYVPSGTSDVRLIDRNNQTSSALTDDVRSTPTHLWVGSWNGSTTAVFYVNTSDNDIYRVAPGSAPVEAVDNIGAEAVVGAGDIDGDGQEELVYSGTSQTVKYVDPDGSSHSTGVGVGKSGGVGAGEPADFDGDGDDRVPIVGGSNNVYLLDASGTKTKIIDDGSAAKTFLAPFNWDTSDSQPEITYVDASTGEIVYVEDVPDSALSSSDPGVTFTGYNADTTAGVA
jgi:hypothetical protein